MTNSKPMHGVVWGAVDGLWWYWLVPVKAEQKSFSDWAQRGEA